MDAAPPPPPASTEIREPAPYVYAAGEYRPVETQARDVELCRKASHTDWLYIAGSLAADVGVIYADTQFFRFRDEPGVRLIGPSLMGLTWGITMGGGYLSLPKCDPSWVSMPPPEGNVRSDLPVMLGIALFSLSTAPFVARIENGDIRLEWAVWERALTVILPMATGFAGAFVPYLLPPRTYRAAKELENLRIGVDKNAATIGYKFAF